MVVHLAARMDAVAPSATKEITARARALKVTGRDVITLSQGEPDFDTPAGICDAGVSAIRNGHTRYTAVAGALELRQAIADKLARDSGLTYGPESILVGCGAKQVIFNALLATLDPGDEVIIPTPCWVSYPDMVRLAGGVPVFVDCPAEDGFRLLPARLAAAVTPRSCWLILNSPVNPTGAVYSERELAELGEVLRRHSQLALLSDEIYEKLVYKPARFATMAGVAPDLRDRILIVNGVSKAYAMTGWRVGYCAGPPELVEAMTTIQGQTTSHTSSISQYAAMAALTGEQSHLVDFLAEFQMRRDFVHRRLKGVPGLDCALPDGAFYLFLSCHGLLGGRLSDGRTVRSDVDLALHLLEAFGVALVPGTSFLAPGHLRLSYATSLDQLERACDRISEACHALMATAP